MRRFFLKLLLVLVAVVGAYFLLASFFGPGAEIRATFDRYKVAIVSGDGRAEAEIVTPETLAHFNRLRRHALASDRTTVAALPFADRLGVFGLRIAAMRKQLTVDTLRIAEPPAFYAAARPILPSRDPGMAKWALTAVYPTGLGEAWATVDPTGLTIEPAMSFMMSLFGPIRYRFVNIDGRWRVDPMPLLLLSASENEYYAVRVEPTGNSFIFNFSQITDPSDIARLWQPIEKQ